jgi:hypothetical protein
MNSRNQIALAILALLFVALAARVWFGFRSQPQLAAGADVYKTVDALFTAVTARDEQRLSACEKRLQGYREASMLSEPAWKRLTSVIAIARRGEWEKAAHRLYDFMQGQRREAATSGRSSRQTAMNAR